MSLLVVGEAEAVHAGALRGGLVGEDCLEGPREERARLPTHHTSDPWVHAPRMRCVRREASFQSPQNSIIETRVGCEARWPRPRHMSEAMICAASGIALDEPMGALDVRMADVCLTSGGTSISAHRGCLTGGEVESMSGTRK
jgi:hypothetical protein